MTTYTDELRTAAEAARVAGSLVLRNLGAAKIIHRKGPNDLVTEADVLASEYIRNKVTERYPKHLVWSEEDTATPETGEGYLWLIDPIDGTTNYARGLELFSTSIALCSSGTVVLGVVYDPVHDLMYEAIRGLGATCNGRKVSVSSIDDVTVAAAELEWSKRASARVLSLCRFPSLVREVGSIRSFGSSAQSLCYLAKGALDIYIHSALQPWDIAAAALIVEEAGGKVTNWYGDRWDIYSSNYVATNGLLHVRVLDLLKTFEKEQVQNGSTTHVKRPFRLGKAK